MCFSENVISGNCNIVEHVINVLSLLSKYLVEVLFIYERNKIIKEMKKQGVIEELQRNLKSHRFHQKFLCEKRWNNQLCIDYIIKTDSYPLLRINDILD